MVCPSRLDQNALLYLSPLAAGSAGCDGARDGTAEQIGVRVVFDRLDLVVLEERITEARGSRETITIFAAMVDTAGTMPNSEDAKQGQLLCH